MKRLLLWLVHFYRRHISPRKAPCCRFYPTCSTYACEALEKRGAFIGSVLTVWRILRCNPLFKGGYDPVPIKGMRYKEQKQIWKKEADEDVHEERDESVF